MIDQTSLNFLKDLKQNNNREWFHANKKRYEAELKGPFQELVARLIEAFQEVDPAIQIPPKDAIFRINRDTRFSKDKSPYKTNVGAIISRYGRKSKEYPGFYVHIEPGNIMMGGGAYFLPKEALYKVRNHIALHLKEFKKILTDKTFTEKFGTIKGEQNKRLPKEFQSVQTEEPLIANKQFYFMAEMDPKAALKEGLVALGASHFKAGYQVNRFLVEAMDR